MSWGTVAKQKGDATRKAAAKTLDELNEEGLHR